MKYLLIRVYLLVGLACSAVTGAEGISFRWFIRNTSITDCSVAVVLISHKITAMRVRSQPQFLFLPRLQFLILIRYTNILICGRIRRALCWFIFCNAMSFSNFWFELYFSGPCKRCPASYRLQIHMPGLFVNRNHP